MKKIEIIWRELLYQTLEKGNNRFVQQDLAQEFKFSTSTIFQALKPLRKMGAVKVGGRQFILQDSEKLLYHWASFRQPKKELIYQTRVDLPTLEIEKSMPAQVIFACFSAYRLKFNDSPADYDQVWVYTHKLDEVKKRFPEAKGEPNLVVLRSDSYLSQYGQTTSLGQTFVDLWNLPQWFAKEFVNDMRNKLEKKFHWRNY